MLKSLTEIQRDARHFNYIRYNANDSFLSFCKWVEDTYHDEGVLALDNFKESPDYKDYPFIAPFLQKFSVSETLEELVDFMVMYYWCSGCEDKSHMAFFITFLYHLYKFSGRNVLYEVKAIYGIDKTLFNLPD